MSGSKPRRARAAPVRGSKTDLAALESPAEVIARWAEDAATDESPLPRGAMTLVTVDGSGQPSARVVICQHLDAASGEVSFLTRVGTRKTRDIAACSRGAALFYWPKAGRQVRLEGVVAALDAGRTDALVLGLPLLHKLGARRMRPSAQPRAAAGTPLGGEAPPLVGGCVGYCLRATSIELWESRPLGGHVARRWMRAGDTARWEVVT